MASESPTHYDESGADDDPLDVIMADYVERLERGERPDPADYLLANPEHAEELRSFFRNHHWMENTPPPEPTSLVGTQVGPYEIEAEIARGGMGVVYRARQQGLQRPVALKLISSGLLAGAEERKRFRIEAEAAARLHHPGIISIHEIGSWKGYEYFSMTLVEGPTLQHHVNRPTFDDTVSARIVRDVARAVAYAHDEGIVHRDLKPENILLCKDDRPLVTDFGLAKWHREGTMITRTGQVLGTPHYMSPEQASGQSAGDVATDVYSLGAILYALLTGHPPHEGKTAAEILQKVVQEEPEAPRQYRREIPADLENICLQAMRSEPSQRYSTASVMAEDLDRFLRGEEILATSSGLIDRVAREIRRDQHQQQFEAWQATLFIIGAVIFVTHVAIFFLAINDFPKWAAYWLPRFTMFAVIFAWIYHVRSGSILPRTVAERPVWSIWLGYISALAVVNVMLFLNKIEHLTLFPLASALSGFGFIAMAGHVWGGSALFGLGFFVVALLAAYQPTVAPLMFGTMWLVSLWSLGRHYRYRD
ncbi:serine/threonine protein kinase [Stieleria varia]|uniref:non-specific serine/threonine protein kinase n=1 Tax=Stieleria varia TaxID=2528005 RepID=A0A5C6B2X6_9BACT|nr:serine/threonine-protein kinase [Stieleria varia]TWU06473.1 Serine/threonine-protein kinase PrkC [Stieleria varia]